MVIVVFPLMKDWAWVGELAAMVRQLFGQPGWGGCVVIGVASGIGEELVFRGALQPLLIAPLGTIGAIVATAAVFGAIHTQRWWMLFAIVIGLAFGALTEYAQSIWPAVLAHALINAINLRRMAQIETRDPSSP